MCCSQTSRFEGYGDKDEALLGGKVEDVDIVPVHVEDLVAVDSADEVPQLMMRDCNLRRIEFVRVGDRTGRLQEQGLDRHDGMNSILLNIGMQSCPALRQACPFGGRDAFDPGSR